MYIMETLLWYPADHQQFTKNWLMILEAFGSHKSVFTFFAENIVKRVNCILYVYIDGISIEHSGLLS